MIFKVHEVKGLAKLMNVYVQFNMDDELEPALQTTILEKQSDLVWDESCDVFIKDVHSKRFTLSVRESSDGVSRNDKSLAELQKISPVDYIGKASVWLAISSTIEMRISCAFLPIDIVMEENEKAENTGVLKLSILNGSNLEGVDSGGTSDPYCVILVNNEKFAKTKTYKKTTSPVFNETFFIPIKQRQRTTLLIQIYDYNAIQKDVLLGTISISLSKIGSGEVLSDDYQIEGASQGKLNIQLLFEAMTGEEVTQSIQVNKHRNNSVTFLPNVGSSTNINESDELSEQFLDPNHVKSIFSAEDLSKPGKFNWINCYMFSYNGCYAHGD